MQRRDSAAAATAATATAQVRHLGANEKSGSEEDDARGEGSVASADRIEARVGDTDDVDDDVMTQPLLVDQEDSRGRQGSRPTVWDDNDDASDGEAPTI